MKAILLTQGYEAIVDDDVADLIEMLGWTWRATVRPHTVYAVRDTPDGSTFRLHRWITDAPAGVLVDHRDGDGLHNWRENLREATKSQNNTNSVLVRGISGFRGVFPNVSGGFYARIKVNQKLVRLGTYPTPEQAYTVYCAKRIELFGEFSPDVCR